MDLTIYNLNEDHRGLIQGTEELVVQLSAGYQDKAGVIYLGDVREVESKYTTPDWITTLGSGDGEKATQFSRVNRSFAAGTKLETVLNAVGQSMGLGEGNLKQVAPQGQLVEAGGEFINGVTVSGQSAREMDRLVRSAGLEWSIQDQTLQLLKAGTTLQDTAIVLTPDTGLIGTPTIGNDGVIEITALMNSDIIPGRQLFVESTVIEANVRAEKCEYAGTTFGTEWYVKIEARELGT
jgi:hypothetical protein